MLLDDGEPGGWRGRWLLAWVRRLGFRVVARRGFFLPVGRNGERGGSVAGKVKKNRGKANLFGMLQDRGATALIY